MTSRLLIVMFAANLFGCEDGRKQDGPEPSGNTSTGEMPSSTSASSGEEGTVPGADNDATCKLAQSEDACGPGCDWTTRYEFPSGSCDALEIVEECRYSVANGDGCGSIVDHPDCAEGSPLLNLGYEYPMFRENPDGSTSIVVSSKCGMPPEYAECVPFTEGLPAACVCLCG